MSDPYLGLLGQIRQEARGQMPLTFCLGVVLEVGPGILRVRADGNDLDEEDLMVSDALRYDFEEEAEITMDSEELAMSGRLMGLSSPCPNGGHVYFDVTGIQNGSLSDQKARYKVPSRLRAGDTVLLIPDRERQIYYLVMKVVSPLESLPPDRPAEGGEAAGQ